MNPGKLIMIGLFTMAVVLTVYGWMDRLKGTNPVINEAFAVQINEADIAKLSQANEPVPTDMDAVKAHQTLLRYARNDFSKGIKFVMDIGKRFFGDKMTLRPDLDVRRLMENYSNPLQGI
jgi:hypothetical protein